MDHEIRKSLGLNLVCIAIAIGALICLGVAKADVVTTEALGNWTLKKGTSNVKVGLESYEACKTLAASKATTTVTKYTCNLSNALTVKFVNTTPTPVPPVVSPGTGDSGPGAAEITWMPPTENTNGTALTDLAGFMLYHNRQNDLTNTESIRIPVGTLRYSFTGLQPDTHYFSLAAVNSAGVQSDAVSVSKSVQ